MSDWIVPDKPGGFDFTGPCKNHDDCYDKCGKSKGECDNAFLNDMKNVCNSVPEVVEGWCYRYVGNGGSRHRIRYRCQKHPRNSCMNYANIYYSAVNSFGKGAYDDAQKANGCCDDKK